MVFYYIKTPFSNLNIEKFTDKNIQYYNHYCNLYIANVMLLEKIKDTLQHKEEQIQKLKRLRVHFCLPENNLNKECSEQVQSSLEEKNINKKKRHRRPAKDIDRHFNCPILKCDKSYGYSFHYRFFNKEKLGVREALINTSNKNIVSTGIRIASVKVFWIVRVKCLGLQRILVKIKIQ